MIETSAKWGIVRGHLVSMKELIKIKRLKSEKKLFW